MAVPHGTLRVSARSILLTVAGLGLTLLALGMAVAAGRVLGWIAAAASVAFLLTPVVDWLHRWLPRGLAVLIVALVMLGGAGLAGYGVGASLLRQYEGVREAVPQVVDRIERSERFGDVAREANLSQRTRKLVDAVPEKLRGGSTADAVRAAATRGVAFIASGILALFFLLHGPKLLHGAVRQLPADRQDRVRQIGARATYRASHYALLTLLEAVVAGIVGYGAARALAVPGAAALGLWLALWAVVPLVGSFIGALPIVAIAGAQNPWHGVIAAAFFVVYQVAEGTLAQRRIDRRTMRLGPFLTTLAGVAGLELYGLGGALVLTLALALVVATLAEVAALRPEGDGAGAALPAPAGPAEAAGAAPATELAAPPGLPDGGAVPATPAGGATSTAPAVP